MATYDSSVNDIGIVLIVDNLVPHVKVTNVPTRS